MKACSLFVCLTWFACCTGTLLAGNPDGKLLPEGKKSITVVITDSGLGGLSVMDHLAGRLETAGICKKANLIFVNALFDADRGYNALGSREAKIDTFSRVLSGIEKNYHPDLILVGCNTLSVLLEETSFYRTSSIPVLGIVDAGVELMAESLEKHPDSKVIITGTETTISEDTHRQALLDMGFGHDRIITQSCPELQSYIERAPRGDDTRMLISVYTGEALSGAGNAGGIFLSLNCSHFGYSTPLWKEAGRMAGVEYLGILNPNCRMTDALVPENTLHRFGRTKISCRVVSKVPLKNREAIADFFRDSSPLIAEALDRYVIDEDLF